MGERWVTEPPQSPCARDANSSRPECSLQGAGSCHQSTRKWTSLGTRANRPICAEEKGRTHTSCNWHVWRLCGRARGCGGEQGRRRAPQTTLLPARSASAARRPPVRSPTPRLIATFLAFRQHWTNPSLTTPFAPISAWLPAGCCPGSMATPLSAPSRTLSSVSCPLTAGIPRTCP